ncbi:GntP family permease [Croceiramulus getboli]|nr:gluconate:H+ symporter [Flavobacteriaceae bacterium YJPT1-3]
MDYQLLLSVLVGVGFLLFLILRLKIQAFLALLLTSILVGVLAGMPVDDLLNSITTGMGSTLGFVATVVGLGALFGSILEYSGGAHRLAEYLLEKFGVKRAPWSIMLTGFLIAIPVFFDVAFIILIPMIYSLQKKTGKSLFLYAIPLLAGLAITHSFIPPTPGPIAVADILGADLGWVILMGFLVGVPAAILAGPIFARHLANAMQIETPDHWENSEQQEGRPPAVGLILAIIFLPIVLIVANTLLNGPWVDFLALPEGLLQTITLLGHPFCALILANILAWYLLGIKRGVKREQLLTISTRSLYPAGVIILLTGAGGAFKQVLIDTGSGTMIAESLSSDYFTPVIFGFLLAAIVRILQGSATVAMITAAGMTAPVLTSTAYSDVQIALIVTAIASGATILSHVNDSGFWLVKQYLGISEKQTLRSWTVMTSIIALTGLVCCVFLWYIV